jgi:hypothetical protein
MMDLEPNDKRQKYDGEGQIQADERRVQGELTRLDDLANSTGQEVTDEAKTVELQEVNDLTDQAQGIKKDVDSLAKFMYQEVSDDDESKEKSMLQKQKKRHGKKKQMENDKVD